LGKTATFEYWNDENIRSGGGPIRAEPTALPIGTFGNRGSPTFAGTARKARRRGDRSIGQVWSRKAIPIALELFLDFVDSRAHFSLAVPLTNARGTRRWPARTGRGPAALRIHYRWQPVVARDSFSYRKASIAMSPERFAHVSGCRLAA